MNEESQLTVFDGYDKQKIEVLFQEEAGLEITVPLFYVNSGKKELESYVEEVCKPCLEEHTVSKQEEIDSRVEEVHKPALAEYTQICQNNLFSYVETISKTDIDTYVETEVQPHSEQAQTSAAAALASEQAAKVSEYKAKESELAAAASATEAKQYRDEAEEVIRPTQATEEKIGLASIATEGEVAAGADDTKFITPLKASQYYQSKTAAASEKANCITAIPQDIKLELNNGTLTLKAGSKGYMGNGTIRTITGEPSLKNTGNAQMFLHITSGGTGLYASYMTGGTVTERPSSPIEYASYYNTTTKVCEYWNGSQWSEISLPIAIVTRGTSGFTSIDQVFNGFGYIGNELISLPGIKGIKPRGFNPDGSLDSKEFETTKVSTFTVTSGVLPVVSLSENGIVAWGSLAYNSKLNLNTTSDGTVRDVCICGTITADSTGRITSFNPKPVFHAVDYYDFLLASDQISTDIKVSSPTGTIVAFGTGTAPQGFLPCNGAAVSRTTYANLFSVIGTTWGAGDGISTFNLPNLNNGIFLKGGTNVGKYTKESLPNITGGDLSSGNVLLAAMRATSSGAMQTGDGSANRFQIGGEAGEAVKAKIDASLSSATYQDGAPVQPNNYTILFCIKY